MITPNTILIGAQKAGTSSLYNWLSQHPEIYAPEEMKDFHFFTYDRYYEQGAPFLQKYYQDAGKAKIIMKGAVNYIFFPHAAPRLHEYDPDLKLLLILRSPKARAISAYRYFYKLGIETLSFREAIERELSGKLRTQKELGDFSYISHGYYHQQLLNYLQYFPLDQFKIVLYEDLIKDELRVLKDIFTFLGVDGSFSPELKHINQTAQARYRGVNRFLFGKNSLKKILYPLLSRIPIEYKIRFGNWIRETNSSSAKVNQIVFPPEYTDVFDEDIASLEQLLGINLQEVWP